MTAQHHESALFLAHQRLDGLGYAVWHVVLPKLTRTRAAAVQLSVPVLASLAGALFVHEPITLSLLLTSIAVLGGIAMVVYSRPSAV
jgi:drug/metabolite transporter (DMT)-like permease